MAFAEILPVDGVSGSSGQIVSPGYPGTYPKNLTKSWRITVDAEYVSIFNWYVMGLFD